MSFGRSYADQLTCCGPSRSTPLTPKQRALKRRMKKVRAQTERAKRLHKALGLRFKPVSGKEKRAMRQIKQWKRKRANR